MRGGHGLAPSPAPRSRPPSALSPPGPGPGSGRAPPVLHSHGVPFRARPGHGARTGPVRPTPLATPPGCRRGRATRLPAHVGGRAPRHAGGSQLGQGRARRRPGRRHHHPAGRRRGRDASQPFASRHRRTVRHPRGPPSWTDRPGTGTGAGNRPGHDRALRRSPDLGADSFPEDVVELINYLAESDGPPDPSRPRAGSGLPPGDVAAGLVHLQRPTGGPARASLLLRLPLQPPTRWTGPWSSTAARFRPSFLLERPHVMVAVSVLSAGTDEEARWAWPARRRSPSCNSARAGWRPSPPRGGGGLPLHPGRAGPDRRHHRHPPGRRSRHRPPRAGRPGRAHRRRRDHGLHPGPFLRGQGAVALPRRPPLAFGRCQHAGGLGRTRGLAQHAHIRPRPAEAATVGHSEAQWGRTSWPSRARWSGSCRSSTCRYIRVAPRPANVDSLESTSSGVPHRPLARKSSTSRRSTGPGGRPRCCHDRSTRSGRRRRRCDEGSRSTTQAPRTRSNWSAVSVGAEKGMLNSAAKVAASRGVRCLPPPPMITGGPGR